MENVPVVSRVRVVQLDLMFDVNSLILDFYPLDFEQDLNRKKQDWKAVVKIPFIEERRLLKAMAGKSLSFFGGFLLLNLRKVQTITSSPHQ
jgi:5'-3' exonuclease